MTVEVATPRPRSVAPGLAGATAVLATLVVVYHRTAAELWRTWRHDENYSHGPLVLVVSAIFAWLARRRLAQAPLASDARGLGLVALACALQILGIRSDVFALQTYSMVLMAFGLTLTFLGSAKTRVLAFPLGYLVFMTIFPPFVVLNLSYALKEVTVAVATRAAETLGVVLQRSGMTLFLATGEVRIENPCSGLRSLVALLATGAVFAALQPGGPWRRLVLFVAAVPLAMVGNALRILMVLLVAHYADVRTATGAFHDQSGFLVYALALLGLLGMRAWLARRPAGATPP